MYKTGNYDNTIQEVTVSKVTDKSVFWIDQRGNEVRELRWTNYYVWHETKELAIAHLKLKWQRQVEAAERTLLFAKNTPVNRPGIAPNFM